jgi:enterobacteria phage integrase
MRQAMTKLRLKFIQQYADRAGKIRRYFRRGGKLLGALPGEVGSEEFMTAYAAYLAEKPEIATRPMHADSLGKLIVDFYGHSMFTKCSAGTRRVYRSVLEPIAREHGHRSVAAMTAEHAEKILSRIGTEHPAMANLTCKALRQVFKLAIKLRRRRDNPFAGLETYKVGEHHTWTDAELKQYETKWRLGTRQRLAYALLLYTGQRVGDVAKMRRADVSEGLIHVVQQKTGAELWLPIHDELDRAMKACPAKGLTLIGDAIGRPVRTDSLSRIVRLAAREAGLPPRCVPHGLRKAAMRRIAEAGGTDKELAAFSGHKSPREIQRYTKAADQKKLAQAAVNKLATKVSNDSGESV